jgi:signal transduction histidine kinase
MLKTTALVPEEEHSTLSSLPPSPAQKRLAICIVLGMLIVALLVTGPLSSVRTHPVAAFLPMYLMAMFLCDSITAILLFAQFAISRSRAVLVIASGYVFTATTLIPYSLTFPGVFAPMPVIGGLQTTAWFFDLWHVGFAIFVIAYAFLKDADPAVRIWRGTVPVAIAMGVALPAALVSAAVFLLVTLEQFSPIIILDSRRFGPLFVNYVAAPVMTACIAAIALLWIRRRTLLDLWLMVVLCLYVVEMPISYYPNPERFSLGWYVARVIGFLNSSILLMVLLYEITTLYARLFVAVRGQRREREVRLMTEDAVAAAIAHEVRQPLTAMITSADAGFLFLNRAAPNVDKAKAAFKLIADDGHRAAAVVRSIRAIFKNDLGNRSALDVNEVIREALALARSDLQRYQILVQAESTKELPEVRGDRIQLQQVLLNLITNAIEAMAAVEGPRVLRVKTEARDGDGVIVSVADTGTGIGSQDISRIFNPRFTTKPDGMGMGLSICRSIVEAHDGHLSVAPNTPRGSVFQFTVRTS